MSDDPKQATNAIGAVIAGGTAAKLIGASAALFEAGGKKVLTASTQNAVRKAAEKTARAAITAATGPLLGSASARAEEPLALLTTAKNGAAVVVRHGARLAGKEVLKGVGKAAGIGLAIDGTVASIEAIVAVRSGDMDRREAGIHVAREAFTGAISTGAGALLGAGLVALTGGVAIPVVFAVGALGSLGTRHMLERVTKRRGPIRARVLGDAKP